MLSLRSDRLEAARHAGQGTRPPIPYPQPSSPPLHLLTPTVASLFLWQSGEVIAADVGTPARLVDRVLIWLLAPAAIESIVYRETSQSEPAIAGQFLEAARRREASLGVDVQDGGWSVAEDEGRVRWAYSEARRLLQRYSGVREALQERMATGVSAGECAVLIEERLRNQWSVV